MSIPQRKSEENKSMETSKPQFVEFTTKDGLTLPGLLYRGKKEERKRFGMAYEKIKECIEDIDGAISFLKKHGYRKFYLAGASTGANKICVYNFYLGCLWG